MSTVEASMTAVTFNKSTQRWDLVEWEPLAMRWAGPLSGVEHWYDGIGQPRDLTVVSNYLVEFWDAKGHLVDRTWVAAS